MRFRLEFAWQPAHRGRTVSQAGCDARSGEKSLERLGAESRFRPSSPSIGRIRSEEHTSELQSREDISYAAFCLKKKRQDVSAPPHLHASHTTASTSPAMWH